MLKFVAGEKGLSEMEDPDAFKLLKEGKKVSGWKNLSMIDS